MPRYFFHFSDSQYHHDDVGTECPSDDIAERQAMASAGAIVHELGPAFFGTRGWKMRVEEQGGRHIVTLYMSGIAVHAI